MLDMLVIMIPALLIIPMLNVSGISVEDDPVEDRLYATIETNRGEIEVKLYEEDAPITVENFVRYAEDGFYQETIFHRVIESFMIQGGGFDRDLDRKEPTYDPIENEAEKSGHRNERGTIAMARRDDPHSATSQFFINTEDNPGLDWDQAGDGYGYCVFGEVVDGMDVVDDIESVETGTEDGMEDVPQEDIIIQEVTVSGDLEDADDDRRTEEDGEEDEEERSGGFTAALSSNIILLQVVISVIVALGIIFYLRKREEENDGEEK